MDSPAASRPSFIRVVAICVFRQDDRILVFEGFDERKNSYFYRPLGGGVEAGETSEVAVCREIREEVGAEVTDLRLLGVIENIFTVNGRAGHEIVFVYDGRFVEQHLYTQESFMIYEDNGASLRASWRALDSFNDYHRLVPPELFGLFEEL
ncbi:MAG: NUDIX hydrolase [Caldilineaceae bacterium]